MTGRPLRNIVTQDIFYSDSFRSSSIGIHLDKFKVFKLEEFFGKVGGLIIFMNRLEAPKPCPFCGGRSIIDVCMDRMYIRPYHKRTCNMKYLDTWLISSMQIEKQIKIWNKRY